MTNKKLIWIVAAVLLVAVVAVTVVLCLPKGGASNPQLEVLNPGNTETVPSEQTVPAEYDYYPKVTFLTHNNEQTQRVEPGTLPQVPSGESGYDNLVFIGWNTPIKAVTGDAVYEAVYEDISEKENVFVINTLYTTETSAQLNLSLRGKVLLSVADLEIHYDPNVIRVEDIVKPDSSIQYNIMPEKGVIKVSVLLTENLEYTMDCFTLKLSFVDPEADVAQLDITVADAACQKTAGKLEDAASGTISGKLVRIS